jgi:hypothetical protein
LKLTATLETETLRRASLIGGILGRDQNGSLDADSLEMNAMGSIYAAVLFIAGPMGIGIDNREIPRIVERIEMSIRRELAQL